MGVLSDICRKAGLLLYPPVCTVCGAGTSPGGGWRDHLCGRCSGRVRRCAAMGGDPGVRACLQCSRVFAGAGVQSQRCAECLKMKPAFDCAVAPFWAGGVVRQVVHQYKYGGKRHLGMLLSEWLCEGWRDGRLRDPPVDLLVPVPLHWWKKHRRGFNQAEDLAGRLRRRVLPGCLGLGEAGADAAAPGMLEVLRRVRWTDSQTKLGRADRLENLRGAFALKRGAPVEGRHVLLVDDVLTTGATLDACAWVLRKGGVASVRALAVARG